MRGREGGEGRVGKEEERGRGGEKERETEPFRARPLHPINA